jgi:hypothetical protein
MSRPGDEKCIDKKGEMWARYQEIKYRREDDRSHLSPGETIAAAGNHRVAALASRKVAAGAGDDSSDKDAPAPAPTPVSSKRRNQNWKKKQKTVQVLAIAIKNNRGSSTDDSKISGSDSDFSDLGNGSDDYDATSGLLKGRG